MALDTNSLIHITCAIDNSFSYPLAVTLESLLENNKDNLIHIHLFSAALSEDRATEFKNQVESFHQLFTFYKLPTSVFKNLRVNDRISQASYYRILIPETIDPLVHKFIYLDADIVVKENIRPFFDINLTNKVLGAIDDIAAIDCKLYKKHSIPEEFRYFNAGVLLVDKDKWISENTTQKLLNYLEKNRDICDFHDQDALNGVLYHQRLPISPIWNQQIGLFFIHKNFVQQIYGNEYQKALKNPVIIHYNGIEKPWHYVSAHPFRKLFEKHAAKVYKFGYKDQISLKKLIKRYLIYRIFGWKQTNRHYYYKTRPISN